MPSSAISILLLLFAVTAWAPQTGAGGALPQATSAGQTNESPRRYYVSPDGSDANDGSEGRPFKTISRAARAARPGTAILVAPGIYEGGFKTTMSGTAEARIRFVSTTKWGAKLIPPAESKSDTAWDNRGSFVEIDGFEIDGSASREGVKWTHGIYSAGSYGVIRNNHVHHIALFVPCTSAGGSAIGVDSYYHGVQIDVVGNVVHDIGPAGCRFVQGIYVSTSGSVQNNAVYRVSEAGIHLWHDATNVVISHNTVAGCHTGIVVGGGDFYHRTGPDDYTQVFNNIVCDCAYGISEQGRTGVHNSYHHNLVYGATVASWSLKNGLKATETVEAAPRFKSYEREGTPDFRLQAGSPAIGRGDAAEGAGRERSGGVDIGAYEH